MTGERAFSLPARDSLWGVSDVEGQDDIEGRALSLLAFNPDPSPVTDYDLFDQVKPDAKAAQGTVQIAGAVEPLENIRYLVCRVLLEKIRYLVSRDAYAVIFDPDQNFGVSLRHMP